MTNVISSSYYDEVQGDGNRFVMLRAMDSDGGQHSKEVLVGPKVDSQDLLNDYAAALDAAFAAKSAAAVAIGAVEIPWTKLEFRRKFADAEWSAFLDFRTTYESSELPAQTKSAIRLGLSDFDLASSVSRTDPSTQAMLNLMVAVGLLTQQRCDEVLSGG